MRYTSAALSEADDTTVPMQVKGKFRPGWLWAYVRDDKPFEGEAPLALQAVRRIDEVLAIEREINGQPPDQRLAVRHARSRPLVDALEEWLRGKRKKLSS